MARAFTLLELLIVLLIVGILIAIGLYKYQSVVEAARASQTKAAVRAVFINAVSKKTSDSYAADRIALASSLNGADGISVTAFNSSSSPAPSTTVGVDVPGPNQVLIAQKAANGITYCFFDDGTKIINGTLVSGTCNPGSGSVGPLPVTPMVSAANDHTCFLNALGKIKCWGSGGSGQLGYGNTLEVGSSNTPAAVGFVDLGAGKTAKKIAAGSSHTCAILNDDSVKCWGSNNFGQLGYGNTLEVGSSNTPAAVGSVDLGGQTAIDIQAGFNMTCALLSNRKVICWGQGTNGKLGYGNTNTIGATQTPGAVGPVDLGVGRTANSISVVWDHVCVVLDNAQLECWGNNAVGMLGYGNTNPISTTQTPAAIGPVSVGSDVLSAGTGLSHTCVVLISNTVKCWGWGFKGRLGYGNENDLGGTQVPSSYGVVDVGNTVKKIAGGEHTTCALLADNSVKCWGDGSLGRRGSGNTTTIGATPTTLPSSVVSADLGPGVAVSQLSVGSQHACIVTTNAQVMCWGDATAGKLGYGNLNNVGATQPPASAGFVNLG